MKKTLFALMALMASVTAGAEAFDLWVAGTQVTTENQDDVLGDGNVIFYDFAEPNKLIIRNTTIDGGDAAAIKSALSSLNIVIDGDVALEGSIGLDLTGENQISCFSVSKRNQQTLTINATDIGIRLTNGTLEYPESIKWMHVTGQNYGLLGSGNAVFKYLYQLNEACEPTTFQGIDQAAISGLKSNDGYSPLRLRQSGIIEPLNTSLIGGTIVDADDNPIKGDNIVKFGPAEPYEFYIGGTYINSLNCNNFRTDGLNGTASYDPTTSTLSLTDVNMTSEVSCIYATNQKSGAFFITAKGDCSLKSLNDDAVKLICNISTISNHADGGSLTVATENAEASAIRAEMLSLYNATLTATSGDAPAINVPNSKITFYDNVKVTATSNDGHAAIVANNFDLGPAAITYPEGGSWNEANHNVVDADGNPASKVIITTEGSGVADITAETSSPVTDIYSLDGRMLAEPVRGINIVRRADGSCSKILVK